jgi:uncharacterized repeat protein (TIGR03943 family)
VVPVSRAWVRVAAWLSLCAVALWILLRGQSDLYMAANVRWTLWLAVPASLGIAALDGYAAWQRGEHPIMLRRWLAGWRQRRREASYALIFLPMVVGIAIPPAIFGTQSVLDNSSAITMLAPPALARTATVAPRMLSLLQLQDHLQAGDLPAGSIVRVSGFAVHLDDLPPHIWLLVRFITPHCVAEAHPLAVLVQQVGGKTIPNDTWVTVTGALHSGAANGQSAAIIVDPQIVHIPMPLDPYLVY